MPRSGRCHAAGRSKRTARGIEELCGRDWEVKLPVSHELNVQSPCHENRSVQQQRRRVPGAWDD